MTEVINLDVEDAALRAATLIRRGAELKPETIADLLEMMATQLSGAKTAVALAEIRVTNATREWHKVRAELRRLSPEGNPCRQK